MNTTRIWLTCLLFLSFMAAVHAQNLPKGLTPEEKKILPEYYKNLNSKEVRGILTPPEIPIRTPAEWEEMDGIVISWQSYSSVLTEIVRHAREECDVYVVCNNASSVQSTLSSAGVNLNDVHFIEEPSNSVWIRDYGQNSVYYGDVDSLFFVDWVYNRPRPQDDEIPSVVGEFLDIPVYQTVQAPNKLVNTGGNFMSDGFGTGFSSNLVLDENSPSGGYGQDLSEEEIDQIMYDFMGIDNYIKMENLPYDGIHHIDMHIKLLNEETLLVGKYPDGVADGPQIEENLEFVLENFKTMFDTDFKVVRIPMPPDDYGNYPDSYGDYRTYTNSLIVNKTVLVPTYEEEYDTTALRIYREHMPGYNVVGIDCNATIPASGAIHCITKEIAAADPLLIAYKQLEDRQQGTDVDTLQAIIKHKSGIDRAYLYYRIKGQSSFNQLEMSIFEEENDLWMAEMPDIPGEQTIEYYVEAIANSGKTQVRPITAPEGFWTYVDGLFNDIPVADAGQDFSIVEGAEVQLTGENSYDPEGETLMYTWEAPLGIELSDVHIMDPVFTAPEVEIPDYYTFYLTVNDGVQDSEKDTIVVEVVQNTPPVADAGDDSVCVERKKVVLNGTSSFDMNEQELTYIWNIPDTITLLNADSVLPHFYAPEVDDTSEIVCTLKLFDGIDYSLNDTVVITIIPNQPPVADAGSDITAGENETIYLDGSASIDPEDDVLQFSWESLDEIELINADKQIATLTTPDVDHNMQLSFTLQVYDGEFYSNFDTIRIFVDEVLSNEPPVAEAGNDFSVMEKDSIFLDASASYDTNGDSIAYVWSTSADFMIHDFDQAYASGIAPAVDQDTSLKIFLEVTDKFNTSGKDSLLITVLNNHKPEAIAGEDKVAMEGDSVFLDASASFDHEHDSLAFQWIVNSFLNIQNAQNTRCFFVAPEVENDTIFSVYLEVHDDFGNTSSDTLHIVILNNDAPVADAGADQEVVENELVYLDASASYDLEVDDLTYHWSVPSLIAINDTNSVALQFTAPEVNADILLAFELVVSDGRLFSSPDTVYITVKNTVHIDALNNEHDVYICPNPNTGDFVLVHNQNENAFIQIFSAEGKLILAKKLNCGTQQSIVFNLQHIDPGLYFVRLTTKSSVEVKRMILE